ncbi:ketosteroid isomerase [Winogradskya humida]|uniref:Ketosteroid isomerase n=2 Tax=Winogradskya humida TaxID=113566 RepID=A0ABQ3ZRI4_9ACTN|nr:ketosteroid isomerase [Actinoplanes humidus]
MRYFIPGSSARQEIFSRNVEAGTAASTSPREKLPRQEHAMDEQAIREVIEGHAAALGTGQVKDILRYYADDAVQFTLAPPLRQPASAQDPEPLEHWLATFEQPPTLEVTALEITAGPEVAFASSLHCMRAVPKGQTEAFELWHRVTHGLRKIEGTWLITHEHQSVPFEMDGSFRASLDLKP